MAEREINLGRFPNTASPELRGEKTALLSFLRQLGLKNMQCSINSSFAREGGINATARITWDADSPAMEMRDSKAIDKIIAQVGKR